jgi:hypothetical protein
MGPIGPMARDASSECFWSDTHRVARASRPYLMNRRDGWGRPSHSVDAHLAAVGVGSANFVKRLNSWLHMGNRAAHHFLFKSIDKLSPKVKTDPGFITVLPPK